MIALLRSALFLTALVIVGNGCAKPEPPPEKKGTHVNVRAPFTSVDVYVPDKDEKNTRVDVKVRP